MRRSFLKCLPLLMMASWAIAEQCQITSPLPVPVSISGCTFAANTLPPGSTGYIQNLLTPTTTTQTFSVQVATVTDKFTESALGGSGTQCVQVDNTGLFTASGTGACGSGGGGGGGYAVEPATVTFNLAKGFTSSTGSITGAAGASVTYGLAVGSMTASSATVAGQLTAGTYQGAGLINCGSTSQAASWSSGLFGCTTITAAGIGALTGNQTVTLTGDVSGSGATSIATTANALQNNITTFGSSITITNVKGSSTTYGAYVGSITVQNLATSGNICSSNNALTTVGCANGTLTGNQTITLSGDSTGSGATAITVTAASLQPNITTFSSSITVTNVKGSSTTYGVYVGSITDQDLTASQFVTTDSNKKLASTLSGATLTNLTGTSIASGIPSSVLPSTVAYLSSTNTWTGYQNFTSSITTAGGVYVSSTILLSGSPGANGTVLTSGGNGAVPTWTSAGAGTITGVQGGPGLTGGGTSGSITLQAASTAAFTTSSNTWTAYQNFTSSITQAGGIYISSTVLLSGAPGSAGQFLTTGGNGTVPTWTTPSAGTGDMILASTQTVTGRKTFQSSTTFQGSVDISSTIILSGSPGASGSLLTSAGNGSVPTWTATSALTNLTGANIASAIPSSVLPSTIDFITSSQTVTAYKNWTSSVTNSGAIYISSTVALNGSPGSNGQVLTSGGNGAIPSWTNVSGGGYTTVADEASNLTQRATLNFTGAGVTCADDAGNTRTNCTIGGGLAAPLSFPMTYQAAICVSSSSSLGFNAFSSSAPVTECIISSSTVFGTAGFVDGSTNAVQSSFWLPDDWTGNIDIYWIWQSSGTSGNVAWQARTGCQTSGETAVGWNVFTSSVTATQATASMDERNKIAALDVTSCTAGDMLTFELVRSGTIGTDTLLPYARLKNVLVVYRRNMTL